MPEFAASFRTYVEGAWAEWAKKEQPRRQSIAVYNRLYTVQQRMIAIGWNRFGDEVYFVLARPNASPFQVPIWMTKPEAAAMRARTLPRIDVASLRDLRRLLDATRSSSDARSATNSQKT
jgi:hypothetical protein